MSKYRRASLTATAIGTLIIAVITGLASLIIVPSDAAWLAAGALSTFLLYRAFSYWSLP